MVKSHLSRYKYKYRRDTWIDQPNAYDDSTFDIGIYKSQYNLLCTILILAIFVVHGEWVNLAIVSAWHLVL